MITPGLRALVIADLHAEAKAELDKCYAYQNNREGRKYTVRDMLQLEAIVKYLAARVSPQTADSVGTRG